MYAFNTLVIMFTSVIFQCLREGRMYPSYDLS